MIISLIYFTSYLLLHVNINFQLVLLLNKIFFALFSKFLNVMRDPVWAHLHIFFF